MINGNSPAKGGSGIGRRRRAALREGGPSYTARREEVVQVAAQLFREKGYERTTLNDVASALGTDRASLYYYVGSKEELLQEIVRRVLIQNLEMAERVIDRVATGRQKIEEIIREMIVSFDDNYPHMFVYIEDIGRISRHDDEWSRDVIGALRWIAPAGDAIPPERLGPVRNGQLVPSVVPPGRTPFSRGSCIRLRVHLLLGIGGVSVPVSMREPTSPVQSTRVLTGLDK
jgi:AcrR family transcriptional regulator